MKIPQLYQVNDMITARNYAAQACAGLGCFASEMSKGLTSPNPKIRRAAAEYITVSNGFVSLCGDAQHFAMPDDGVVFEDNLRGLRNNFARLPFKVMTLEYHVNEFYGANGKCNSPKRVLLAIEIDLEMFTNMPDAVVNSLDSIFPEEDSVAIQIMSAFCQNGTWVLSPVTWILPEKWDSEGVIENVSQIRIGGGKCSVFGINLPLMPGFCEIQSPETYKEHVIDITQEVAALLEFIEALSCVNVTTAVHQEESKLNAKRAKRGKVPIWETKVLTIDVPIKRSLVDSKGGTHSSPKQHLRRGHIRRLDSGNIWVNSCVVGSPENGNVEKNYIIRKAR